MKFTCSVMVHKPKKMVADYFANPNYLGKYQEGFIRKELISGEIGKEKTVSKMYYKMKNGEMELTETILKNDLPNSFSAFYFHKHTENTMTSTFKAINNETTLYTAEIHYTKFKGILVNILKFLFPSMFKKQVQKWLNNFKLFVEKQ